MEKYKNEEGKVAVLVSHGFGAGWWTWNSDNQECLFDPEIVKMVLDERPEKEIEATAQKKWPDGYWGGADGLSVHWLEEGEQFTIEEYDGSESLRCADDRRRSA